MEFSHFFFVIFQASEKEREARKKEKEMSEKLHAKECKSQYYYATVVLKIFSNKIKSKKKHLFVEESFSINVNH